MKALRPTIVIATALLTGSVAVRAQGNEVSVLVLYKAAWYQQPDVGDPGLLPPSQGPYDFYARAYLSEEFLSDPDALMFITGMSLRTPSGRTESMNFDGSGSFAFGADAVSPQALNVRYGAGTYRFTLSSLITGSSVFSLTLGGDDYPPAPKVTNFTAAQGIDPAKDFALEWTEFTGEGDREIWLEVQDPASGSGLFQAGPLAGTDRKATVPAGTLEADRDYRVRLTFTRYTQGGGAQPEVYTAFEAYNFVPIRTVTGGSLQPSSFSGWQRLPNGDLELTIDCAPGRALTVEGAAALSDPWQALASQTPNASPAKVVLSAAALGNRQFLRAKQL